MIDPFVAALSHEIIQAMLLVVVVGVVAQHSWHPILVSAGD
jgi:hypothetical protein